MAIDTTSLRTRRAVLLGLLGGTLGAAASSLGRAIPVSADNNGEVVRIGHKYFVSQTTEIDATGNAIAISASSDSGIAVGGGSNSGDGLSGSSGSGNGVSGDSEKGIGVVGVAWGSGRGGQFAGGTAQLRLVPSADAKHPHEGKPGDLFLDGHHRLWFCKGGTEWVKLA